MLVTHTQAHRTIVRPMETGSVGEQKVETSNMEGENRLVLQRSKHQGHEFQDAQRAGLAVAGGHEFPPNT